MNDILAPKVRISPGTGLPEGEDVFHTLRRLEDLAGVFEAEHIRKSMDQEIPVYEVQAHLPVKEGTPAGLFYGATIIYPGKVGDEYFMTKGHFHARSDRAEYYWGISGEGVLLLMDRSRKIRAERISKGSLHYIPGDVAHRTVNTGKEKLIIGACWPSDAGHDYEEIMKNGFAARVVEKDGKPFLKKLT